ncbi:MAG: T9SS type A sorting domain-containing protein [Ignavibacteria bacterium]
MKKIIIIAIIFLFVNQNTYSQSPPVLMDGFPIVLDSIEICYQTGSSAIVANFGEDNEKRIFVGVNVNSAIGKIFLIDNKGKILANFPKLVNCFTSYIETAAGDINGDGTIDLVVRADSLYVFDYKGNYLPGFPVYLPHPTTSLGSIISLYDFENNGKLEIITVKQNKIYVLNHDGTVRNGWPKFIDIGERTFISTFAIGDLNNDNIPEMIFPCRKAPGLDSNMIFILNPDGDLSFSPIVSDSNYYFDRFNNPVIYKSDNEYKFAVISNYTPNGMINTYKSRFTIFNNTGEIEIQNNRNAIDYNESLTAGNFTNSDYFFIYGNTFFQIFAENNNGSLLPGFPVISPIVQYRSSSIGKLTDKYCFVSFPGNQDTLGGMGLRGYLSFWNTDAQELSWSPLRPIGLPASAPTFCDLNNDGQADMLFTTNGFINGGDGCGLYAWTFPGVSYTTENFPWPMYGHDRYRTFQHGFIPPDEPVGILPINNIIPDKFELHQNYPNPFNPVTNIKFDIRNSSDVRLNIYDALGRKITELINEKLQPGTYNAVFDGSNFSSGVYFYKLETEGFSETKRMILLK